MRPEVCPDPQRCPEGTIFTVSSSALLADPGDTEYTPSVEGPGVLDVKGLSWLRLFWGPSASPRVPPRYCGVRTSLQAPPPLPRRSLLLDYSWMPGAHPTTSFLMPSAGDSKGAREHPQRSRELMSRRSPTCCHLVNCSCPEGKNGFQPQTSAHAD